MSVTENITVLFTDLVGSTELAASLTPKAGDEIRRGHFSVLRQAVAGSGGTEIKNLGDGIMVVFPTASAALACAVAMQQGVDRDNRGLPRPLGLRVGLSAGDVAREADDYFGDPVVEAARLCAEAKGGQILAAELVRALAGRRNRHECRPLGRLALKGLPDPMETVEVIWEPLAADTTDRPVPLPNRLAVRRGPGVVGRETELGLLAEAARRVTDGGGRQVLLVSGEAGLGKTTLVAEASRSEFERGAVVLFGHCEEDLATPYQLFAEALDHYVTHAPEDEILDHVAVHGSELAKLVPALTRRIADLPPSRATDSDTERFLLFSAVVGLLAQASASRPVVLVLDDMQWADEASLSLFRYLAASDPATGVLVLGTYRDDELSPGHALNDALAALHRLNGITRVSLTGLDDAGVVALMEAVAGYTLDEDGVVLAHAVTRETDGNPFFVTEILRHLAETGAIYQDATGHWVAEGGLEQMALPDSLRVVIGSRVGRLGDRAAKVLSTAAVIGRDFDLDVVARATATEEDDLLDILDAATAVSLVREPSDASGRYSFAHALIQHTLAEDLGPNRRARAHRRIAEALEELCGDRPGARVGELARHWLNASQPVDIRKALDYSRQAGDAALAALAPADALRHYAQALQHYPETTDPDPALALDLSIGLGTAQRQTGEPAFRGTLLKAAHKAAELGDTDRLVAAALANSRGFYSSVGATDKEKVEILEKALERLPASHPDRALVLATLCSELAHGSPLDRRQALAEEAIAIAEASQDDTVVLRVLNHVHISLQVPSMLETTHARASDGLLRAERIGDPVLLFFAAQWRAESAARTGDLEEMDRCIAIHGAMAEQLNQPVFLWGHAFVRSMRAQIAGDVELAEEYATEALRIGTEGGQPDAGTFFGGQFNIICGQRGTQSELAPLIEKMASETPDIPRRFFVSLLAKAHVEGDRIDVATGLLEESAAEGFELPQDQWWLTGMVDFAEAAIECHDPVYAEPLVAKLEPWAGQLPATGGSALGPVSHYLGGLATVLGRYEEADAYFAQSAEMSRRMGAKFFAARTDLLWGRMLAERGGPGDAERAHDLLVEARRAAVEHGYGNVERRAGEMLERLGG